MALLHSWNVHQAEAKDPPWGHDLLEAQFIRQSRTLCLTAILVSTFAMICPALRVQESLAASMAVTGIVQLADSTYAPIGFAYPQGTQRVFVEVADADRNVTGAIDTLTVVFHSASQNPGEVVVLTESGTSTGTFRGSIPLDVLPGPFMQSGTEHGSITAGPLSIRPGESIFVTYYDPMDVGGLPHAIVDSAVLLGSNECLDQTGNGFVGVYADPAGTQPCASVAPNPTFTLYVIATLTGATAAGITGAEFRLELSNPTGYAFLWTPDSSVTISLGDPIDSEPANPNNGSGVNIAFSTCQGGTPGARVRLGTLEGTTLNGGPLGIEVKRRQPASNGAFLCPLFAICDPPTYTIVPMTRSEDDLGREPVAFSSFVETAPCNACMPALPPWPVDHTAIVELTDSGFTPIVDYPTGTMQAYVQVLDPDADRTAFPDSVEVVFRSPWDVGEPVQLIESGAQTGEFRGSIAFDIVIASHKGMPLPKNLRADGLLQIQPGDTLTVTHHDLRDVNGLPHDVVDRAVLGSAMTTGVIQLTDSGFTPIGASYPIGTTNAFVEVVDADRDLSAGLDSVIVVFTSPSDPGETVMLTETGTATGIFRGTIPFALVLQATKSQTIQSDGFLQIHPGETLRVTYDDPTDVAGQPRTVFDEALLPSPGTTGIVTLTDQNFVPIGLEYPVDVARIWTAVQDFDRDLTSNMDSILVTFSSSIDPLETVFLRETGPSTGVFRGGIDAAAPINLATGVGNNPAAPDGRLQIFPGATVTVSYDDPADEFGLPRTIQDLATIGLATDCYDQNGNGFIGVYADAAGTQSCISALPFTATTAYVIATLGGAASNGITAAEFRLEFSNAAGYFITFTPNPEANIVLGSPIDTNPSPTNSSGVNIVFQSCQGQLTHRVLMGTLSIFNTNATPVATVVRTSSKVPPSNPSNDQPLFVLCDAPVFTKVGMTPTRGVLGRDPIAFVSRINASTCDACRTPTTGSVTLTNPSYVPIGARYPRNPTQAHVEVSDYERGAASGTDSVTVTFRSLADPGEVVILRETGDRTGVFRGSIPLQVLPAPGPDTTSHWTEDGILQIARGDTLVVFYQDSTDANGASIARTARALVPLIGVTGSVDLTDAAFVPIGATYPYETTRAYVQVDDSDLNVTLVADSTVVTFDSPSDTTELVILVETGASTGVFRGSIPLAVLGTLAETRTPGIAAADGQLQVRPDEFLEVTYVDSLDATGQSVALVDSAILAPPRCTGTVALMDSTFTTSGHEYAAGTMRAYIEVLDCNAGSGAQVDSLVVHCSSQVDSSETVALFETSASSGRYRGSIALEGVSAKPSLGSGSSFAVPSDGRLQVPLNGAFLVRYEDTSDESGAFRIVTTNAILRGPPCFDQVGNGWIGVYADSNGVQPCAIVAPLVSKRLYVIATLLGGVSGGIRGAEFRLEMSGLVSQYFISWVARPGSIAIGSPIDLDPSSANPSGVLIALPTCTGSGAGSKVLLGWLDINAIPGVAPLEIRVKPRDPPSTPAIDAPSLVLCDEPTFTQVPLTPTANQLGREPVVFVSGVNHPNCGPCAGGVDADVQLTDEAFTPVGGGYPSRLNAAFVQVTDADRDVSPSIDSIMVSFTSSRDPGEIVSLFETSAQSGIFRGSIPFDTAALAKMDLAVLSDGLLQIRPGDSLAVTFQDPQGFWGPVTVTDRARLNGTSATVQLTDANFIPIGVEYPEGTPFAYVEILDGDRDVSSAMDAVSVTFRSPVDASENVVLTESGTNTGVFRGFIPLDVGAQPGPAKQPTVRADDGSLQLFPGQTILVTYADVLDSLGGSRTVTDKTVLAGGPTCLDLNGHGTIGVYLDAGGTQQCFDLPPGVPSLYVVATLAGASATGIQGAEFRLDLTNLVGAIPLGFSPASGATFSGNPIDTNPADDASGARILLSTCQGNATGDKILLGTLQVLNLTPSSPSWISVRRRNPPSEPDAGGPLLFLCDADSTRVPLTHDFPVLGREGVAFVTGMGDSGCTPTCLPPPPAPGTTAGVQLTDDQFVPIGAFYAAGTQQVYVEVVDPDMDATAGIDSLNVSFDSPSDSTEDVILVEIGATTGVFRGGIALDVLEELAKSGRASNLLADGMLQIRPGDSLVVSFVDPLDGVGVRRRIRDSAILRRAPPDLRVSTVSPADSVAFAGGPLLLQWVVANRGAGRGTLDTWTDAVFLSTDSTLDAADTLLARIAHVGFLHPDSTYAVSQNLTLPGDRIGLHYVFVRSDVDDVVDEAGFESNNVGRAVIRTRRPPDLQITQVSVPDSAWSGQGTYVTWTALNAGDAPTTTSWFEFVYLSSDSTSLGTKIAEFSYPAALVPGATYTHAHPIVLPQDISGPRWITIGADGYNTITEYALENNNRLRSARSMYVRLTPWPNLVVESLVAPDSVRANSQMDVTWIVTNRGETGTSTPVWHDRLFLKRVNPPGSPITLATFPNLSHLPKNSSYQQANRSVTIPNGTVAGAYTLSVQTDVNNTVDEHGRDNDNTRSRPITILPDLFLPDLAVNDPTLPSTGWAGLSINVAWTVTNLGVRQAAAPVDEIVLARHRDPATPPNHHFGPYTGQALQPPGQSPNAYSRNVSITLPDTLDGKYYVQVITDPNHQIQDADPANNFSPLDSILVRRPPPSDLQVESVLPLASNVEAGRMLRARWMVVNRGAGPTLRSTWVDELYLSADDSLDTAADPLLARVQHQGILEPAPVGSTTPASSYVVEWDVPTPGNLRGTYRLIVKTDADQVVDESQEDNNVLPSVALVNLTDPPPSNLAAVLNPLAAPILSGQTVSVSWSATNLGPNATAVSSWTDAIYLSTDSVLAPGAQPKILAVQSSPVGLNASYSRTRTLQIPNGISGSWFIVLRVDVNDQVFESGQEADNTVSLRVAIALTPSPDLVVDALAVPDTVDAGQLMLATWSVNNQGLGPTVGVTWVDAVYLSPDSVQTGTLLATAIHTGALSPGQSYPRNASVLVPTSAAGWMYVGLATDYDDRVYEHLEMSDNNSRNRRVFVRPFPKPNLKVSSVQFVEGLIDSVRYRVTNIGGGAIPSAQWSWTDRIYMSLDSLLDGNDLLVASAGRSGDLLPGDSYEKTLRIRPADGTQGLRYLFVSTDATARVVELDETDNVDKLLAEILLTPPDLQVTATSEMDTLIAGQPVSFQWTVTNRGIGITDRENWTDIVILSPDLIADVTDFQVGAFVRNGSLLPNSSYQVSMNVTIPQGVTGLHYLIVETDRLRQVYEHVLDDNNFRVEPGGALVFVAPSADLRVTAIDFPDTVVTGESIPISWTVANFEPVAVTGQWRDAVYVSADSIWSLDDLLVGDVLNTDGLPPGALYKRQLMIPSNRLLSALQAIVPGLLPGGYHVIVRTDILNNIPETNDENNDTESPGTMGVDLRSLVPPDSVQRLIQYADRHYYRIALPASDDVELVFGDSLTAELEIHASFGEIPDRITAEFESRITTSGTRVIIPRTSSGDLYLLVYGDFVIDQGSYRMVANVIPFGITAVEPLEVGNAGLATIAITGGQLTSAVAARLRRPGGQTHTAWNLHRLNRTSVLASFDLAGAEPGQYDVVLVTSTPDSVELLQALTVRLGGAASILANIEGPAAIRQGSTVDYLLTLDNIGTQDAFDVLTGLKLDAGAEYQLILDGTPGGERVSDGTAILLHTDAIHVGAVADWKVRLTGTSTVDIVVIATHETPTLLATTSVTRAVSPWLLSSVEAFATESTSLGAPVAASALQTALLDGRPEATGQPQTSLLDAMLASSIQVALDSLANPDVTSGIAQSGIGAASVSARNYYDVSQSRFAPRGRKVILRVARDPNEKIGAVDSLGGNFVTQAAPIPYTVHFENVPTAQAAAQQVVITDRLDPALDTRTFRLGEIAFGGRVVSVPPNKAVFATRITLESGHLVDIDAGVDTRTGVAHWNLITLDPVTGRPPLDPDAGFLPPNDSTGVGQGHVVFSVRAHENAPENTILRNSATITFDVNEPIVTNTVENTLRRTQPDLQVVSTSATAAGGFLEGERIDLSATIGNLGEARAREFRVGFYDGDPTTGVAIDLAPRVAALDTRGEATVTASWTPNRIPGTRTIHIRADEGNNVGETIESNNVGTLALQVLSRNLSMQVESGINFIAVPLQPEQPWTARSLAMHLRASIVVACDSVGRFESFVPGVQSGDGFSVSSGPGYLVVAEGDSTVQFTGVTNPDSVRYRVGWNCASLPKDPGVATSARTLATLLSANQIVRWDEGLRRFESFIPDFHSTNGFILRGGEGYLAFQSVPRLVHFAGKGWHGQQAAQEPWGAPQVEAAGSGSQAQPLFVVVGRVLEEKWGESTVSLGGYDLVVTNERTGIRVSSRTGEATGEYTTTLLDWTNGDVAQVGDRIQVTVQAAGIPIGESRAHLLSEVDVRRFYAEIDVTIPAIPRVTILQQNFPNPFNPTTRIRYQLATAGQVALRVYDVRGRLVRTLVQAGQEIGFYEVRWDGLDDEKRSVASGVYIYRLMAASVEQSRKLVIVR